MRVPVNSDPKLCGWLLEFLERARFYMTPAQLVKTAVPPMIVFNPRMTTYAGRAHPRAGYLEINPKATPDHQRDTVGHELAHWLAVKLDGEWGHKRAFIKWCHCVGIASERCHAYPELLALRVRRCSSY